MRSCTKNELRHPTGLGSRTLEPVLQLGPKRKPPKNAQLMAYADDLATITTATTKSELEVHAELALNKTASVLHNLGLEVAVQNTELLLLNGRRNLKEMEVKIDGTAITSKM